MDWLEEMREGSIELGLTHVVLKLGNYGHARMWCSEQLGHPRPMRLEDITDAHLWAAWGCSFYFRREQDAMLFKLGWVG